jgi:hypothetical protein
MAAGNVQRRAAAERRLGEIERETERLVDAIAKGFGDPSILGGRINELKSERIQLADEIAAMPNADKVITLHPGLLARYEQQVEQLQVALAAGLEAEDEDGAAALRELIEAVKVERNASSPGGVKVTIVGRLNVLLGEEHFPNGVCGEGRKQVHECATDIRSCSPPLSSHADARFTAIAMAATIITVGAATGGGSAKRRRASHMIAPVARVPRGSSGSCPRALPSRSRLHYALERPDDQWAASAWQRFRQSSPRERSCGSMPETRSLPAVP